MKFSALSATAWIAGFSAIALASCTLGDPSINVKNEVSALEHMVSTTDTSVALEVMSKRGVVMEKSGSSPLYEYYAVGKLPGYEMEYHLSPMGIGALVLMGEDNSAEEALRAELAQRGYERGEDRSEPMEIMLRGVWMNLDRVHESYQLATADGSFDFWIETLQDDGDVVDFSFGASAPRLGRSIMSQGVASKSETIIVGDKHLLWGSIAADTIAYSLLVERIGAHNRMFEYSESEGPITAAVKRSMGLPKVVDKSDHFVYDTLGLRLNVNRETGRLSSMIVFLKPGNWDYAPSQPFTGNLVINGHYLNGKTKLVDLLNWGIGQPPADNNAHKTTFETSNGTFDLKFDFDFGAMTMTSQGTTYTGDGSLKEVEIRILRNNAEEVRPR